MRDAAVLVPSYFQSGKEFVVLTVRTPVLTHHSNQIAFPGGAKDETDATLWDTALRETHEELGLEAAQVEFVAELGQQITPTGYRVTPFVGRIVLPDVWQLNEHEISEVFSVPLDHLREPNNLQIEHKVYGGERFLDPHFFYQHHVIWGMTGRVLYEFLSL